MGNRQAGGLLLLLVVLLLEQGIEAQPDFHPKPLCLSQYTLANRACALLSIERPQESKQLVEQEMHELHGRNDTRNHGSMQEGEHETGRHREKRHHRRRHHHHRHHHHNARAHECCRWLENIDSECVCDILKHLPLFLSKPHHNYTLEVEDNCTVVYSCGHEDDD